MNYSNPGLWHSLRKWGAQLSDGMWREGLVNQTSKFYSDPAVRDVYAKIFGQQALEIRPAFFGLNAMLSDEVEKRQQELPRMKAFSKHVAIIFGGDDPYLNINVAKEFDAIFPNSSIDIIPGAGHYVQLDSPGEVSRLILKQLTHQPTGESL